MVNHRKLAGTPLTKPIRVAVVAEPPGGSTDPVVAAVARRAADTLSNAGYDVVNVCLPRYEDAITCWAKFVVGDFCAILARLLPLLGRGRVGKQPPESGTGQSQSALAVSSVAPEIWWSSSSTRLSNFGAAPRSMTRRRLARLHSTGIHQAIAAR